jgi:Cd2+/Zn2+-exporting ATPase/Cu+-exporting ATPase
VHPAPGVSLEAVIGAAAIAERRSEHPLGAAIIARADALGFAPDEPARFDSVTGRGIVATTADQVEIVIGSRVFFTERNLSFPANDPATAGATEVLVARAGNFLGTIQIADATRAEARGAIDALKALGIRTLLLTGDTQAVAQAVAGELGIDDFTAGLLPEDKRARIATLIESGRKVAMVGDGVNDAPALAEASVGIAMGSGTDVARESADIVLLGNDLARLVESVRIARRTRRIIRQNFTGTIAVDMLGMALAGFGFLDPLLAAFIHVASELTFILNSTRMLPARGSRQHMADSMLFKAALDQPKLR